MRLLFSLLFFLSFSLCADIHMLDLGKLGNVRYTYDGDYLLQVERLSPSEEVIYRHVYHYEEDMLIRESLIGDLGEIVYEGDFVIKSPYSLEICEYDQRHNLVRHTQDELVREYRYDELDQMIRWPVEQQCVYDIFGNLIQKDAVQFRYDDENRLIEVLSPDHLISYEYDVFGNRVSRTINGELEWYLYFGINEIAICDESGWVKELRIPGRTMHRDILRPIAIEVGNAIYAPIHDVQGNITKLIEIASKEVISLDKADPFGGGLSKNAPTSWIFAGKHYDREADLVYFGARYYAPELQQWMTVDPLHQNFNSYQYCMDNPFSSIDPDGQWSLSVLNIAWGAGAAITSPIWAPYVVATAAGMAVGYCSYKMYKNLQDKPPYSGENLGEDASKRPGEGFEWRGKGDPKSGKGSWHNSGTKESLHPDFDHPGDIKPHWDYKGPEGEEARLYTDGTWEWK